MTKQPLFVSVKFTLPFRLKMKKILKPEKGSCKEMMIKAQSDIRSQDLHNGGPTCPILEEEPNHREVFQS